MAQLSLNPSACPPGQYRPGVFYDCRPVIDPGVVQQDNAQRAAGTLQYQTPEQYAAQQAQAQGGGGYVAPPVSTFSSPFATAASSPLGIDQNMLLIGGLILALIFLMKK